jgi:hypothetical protein
LFVRAVWICCPRSNAPVLNFFFFHFHIEFLIVSDIGASTQVPSMLLLGLLRFLFNLLLLFAAALYSIQYS